MAAYHLIIFPNDLIQLRTSNNIYISNKVPWCPLNANHYPSSRRQADRAVHLFNAFFISVIGSIFHAFALTNERVHIGIVLIMAKQKSNEEWNEPSLSFVISLGLFVISFFFPQHNANAPPPCSFHWAPSSFLFVWCVLHLQLIWHCIITYSWMETDGLRERER